MTKHLIDNVAVEWLKTLVQSYVYTMKQLVQNTFVELYPESWSSSSSAASLTSQDMLVLATACFNLFGLVVSLGVIYTICKVVCWICTDRPTTRHSECAFVVILSLFYV